MKAKLLIHAFLFLITESLCCFPNVSISLISQSVINFLLCFYEFIFLKNSMYKWYYNCLSLSGLFHLVQCPQEVHSCYANICNVICSVISCLSDDGILTGLRKYCIVGLICISLTVSYTEHLFKHLLFICVSSLEKEKNVFFFAIEL